MTKFTLFIVIRLLKKIEINDFFLNKSFCIPMPQIQLPKTEI